MMPTSNRTVTALQNRTAVTASSVGRIGVRLASTRKVMSADSSASPTATTPSRRASRPGAAVAATASSAVAAWPTLVINARPLNRCGMCCSEATARSPPRRSDAFVQQCCRIATIPGRIDARSQKIGAPLVPLWDRPEGADRHVWPRRIKRRRASSAGAEHLDIQVPDLLAQRIAVETEEIGGADLVAAGGGQRDRQQRIFDLAQDPVVEPGRRKLVTATREIGREMPFDRRRQPFVGARLFRSPAASPAARVQHR